MLYTAKGVRAPREVQCLPLDHLMEPKNKTKYKRTDFQAHRPFLWTSARMNACEITQDWNSYCKPGWGWTESSCLRGFLAEIWIWLHLACARYCFPSRNLQLWALYTRSCVVTSLQIPLSCAPFFSTRYVQVQLFRLEVAVVWCVFRISSLGFVSRLGLNERELRKIMAWLVRKVVLNPNI